MDAYSELIEPTRVSQCVGCHFILPTTRHLVVGKASILQVFEVVQPSPATYKLKLVEQYRLNGLITDLKPIRTVESPSLDYLLVSTKFAKFSLIKWDHALHSISTVSLHYYEHAVQNLVHEKVTLSSLILEPNNYACTCLRFDNLMIFLPFVTGNDNDEDDDDDDANEAQKTAAQGQLFDSSFIVEAANLDADIGTIIDMQFLHNYREPTLAIIHLKQQTWAGKLPQVKDNVTFTVLTLDLESQNATTVLKIDNLPYDIDRLIPLPPPLNGSLLLGCNEIIHVDNGGITRRVSLNKYTAAITTSTKNYLDQTALGLMLENCAVVPIPNDNRVLLVLEKGDFYYINFEVDGKTIKRVSVDKVDESHGVQLTYPGQMATLDHNLLFISNGNGNAPLVELRYKDVQDEAPKGQETALQKTEDDDEDDLYNEDEVREKQVLKKGAIEFVQHDELLNNGPVSKFALGHYTVDRYKANLINPNTQEVALVSNGGSGKQGHLNIFTPSINPVIKLSLSFSQINRMWTVNNKYLITSDETNAKSEIFQINKSFARLKTKHFDNSQTTIAMHELNDGKFILRITPKHITLFNSAFKKVVSVDEELSDIIYSTFNDEFLMVFLSSGEVHIYQINTYNESFTKISIPKLLADTIITTGYIANSRLLNAVLRDVNLLINRGTKRKRGGVASAKNDDVGPKLKIFVLVLGDNRVVAFNRFHNERCYQLNDIDKFTDQLSLGFFEPRDSLPDPFIKQVVFNELGDQHSKDEYLTILTVGGEILLYKMYFDEENFQFAKVRNVPITGAPDNAYPYGTTIERRLAYFPNLSGLTCILVTGIVPYAIIKTSHSVPRVFKFTKLPAVSFALYSDGVLQNGLIYLDTKKNARVAELPRDFNYDNKWPVKHIPIGETVKSVSYHEGSNTFVLSTLQEIRYNAIDEVGAPIVGIDKEGPGAISYKGSIKLVSPFNWSVIDTIELADDEVGMTVKLMVLDVGSSTKSFKNKKEYVVVGTGKYRMEDLAANGSFRVIEIIDIIPEPGRPETNHKFKQFHKEDTRGAVTAITEISGRFLVSQGQKVIARDIQDNGVIPVAFLDTSVYVTEAKNFGNLLVLGDSLKSVWLVGFDAEPFRMITLGKSLQPLDVSCADFIVKDEEIFLLVADLHHVLHLVQYNPEDPASSNGQILLHKAAFNVNLAITCMEKLPKFEGGDFDYGNQTFQTVGLTIDGAFFAVFPLSEATYRRMYILQQQLIDKEYHYCGLNPRLNRFGGLSSLFSDTNAKPILDHDLVRGFARLNDDRRRNLTLKVSNNQQDVWKDLIEMENVMNYF